jgi:hypothetical protein
MEQIKVKETTPLSMELVTTGRLWWPLASKVAGSNPAEAVGFLQT